MFWCFDNQTDDVRNKHIGVVELLSYYNDFLKNLFVYPVGPNFFFLHFFHFFYLDFDLWRENNVPGTKSILKINLYFENSFKAWSKKVAWNSQNSLIMVNKIKYCCKQSGLTEETDSRNTCHTVNGNKFNGIISNTWTSFSFMQIKKKIY